jgi:hypothetical protein
VSDVPECITPVVVVPRALDAASVVTGVGHNPDDEEPFASVGCADVSGCDDASFHVIPGADEIGDNDVHPARSERCNVFDDDDERPKLADDAVEFSPQAGTRTAEPRTLSCDAEILAGEPAANNSNVLEHACPDRFDVIVPPNVRPLLREHPATPRIDLDLPHRASHPAPFEP